MMGRKVLVLGDIRDGVLRNVSFEAIAAAKLIADGGEVVVALFGESIGEKSLNLLHYGADRVVKAGTSRFERVYDGCLPTSVTPSNRYRKA